MTVSFDSVQNAAPEGIMADVVLCEADDLINYESHLVALWAEAARPFSTA
jgi:hypothetical protein